MITLTVTIKTDKEQRTSAKLSKKTAPYAGKENTENINRLEAALGILCEKAIVENQKNVYERFQRGEGASVFAEASKWLQENLTEEVPVEEKPKKSRKKKIEE